MQFMRGKFYQVTTNNRLGGVFIFVQVDEGLFSLIRTDIGNRWDPPVKHGEEGVEATKDGRYCTIPDDHRWFDIATFKELYP